MKLLIAIQMTNKGLHYKDVFFIVHTQFIYIYIYNIYFLFIALFYSGFVSSQRASILYETLVLWLYLKCRKIIKCISPYDNKFVSFDVIIAHCTHHYEHTRECMYYSCVAYRKFPCVSTLGKKYSFTLTLLRNYYKNT